MTGVAGTAAAIDQVAILSPEQRTVETAPGETIEIDVILRSQGGHGGEGVSGVALPLSTIRLRRDHRCRTRPVARG